MFSQERLSDEEFRPFAVPYSCCSLRSMTPCFHMDLSMNAKSVNEAGCAEPLSRIVFRNAALAYCVSTFLVLTQILLGVLIVKVNKLVREFLIPHQSLNFYSFPSILRSPLSVFYFFVIHRSLNDRFFNRSAIAPKNVRQLINWSNRALRASGSEKRYTIIPMKLSNQSRSNLLQSFFNYISKVRTAVRLEVIKTAPHLHQL